MAKQPKRKKSASDYLLTLLLLLAVGIFVFAAAQLYSIFAEYKRGSDEYDKLEKIAVSENPNQSATDTTDGAPAPGGLQPPITVDFTQLQALNPDVAGWLYIEGIDASYPIVQGSDNDWYLHHTYEGNDNSSGSIFLDYANDRDFNDCNSIIYGHNMKNGTMFGTLKSFTEGDAYKKSPYFWILTPEEDYRYEIFAAYVALVDSDTYTLFRGPGQEFLSYLHEMKANTELETREMEMGVKDKVVTLSTCTGNNSTRYVVQGLRLTE